MRQLFLDGRYIQVKDVATPFLDAHSVLVATAYSCISAGTENATIAQAKASPLRQPCNRLMQLATAFKNHGLDGTLALIQSKMVGAICPLGYSLSGKVIAVGEKVKTIALGDWVACAGAESAHHAEFVVIREQLSVKISDEQWIRQGSLTTMGAIALQGVRRAQLQIGDFVAVIGLGLLGQLTVQLAQRSGARVIGIDLLPERLEMAHMMGAERVYHAHDKQLMQDILNLTAHQGVDSALLTAATPEHSLIQEAITMTRKKGKIVIVGDIGLHVQRQPFYEKELDVVMSCSYGPGRYDPTYEQDGIDYPYAYVRWTERRNMQAFVTLLEQNILNISPLITHEFSLDQAQEAYEQTKRPQGLAILIRYGSNNSQVVDKPVSIAEPFFIKKPSLLRIGLIGCGGFAKTTLLPILSKISSVKLAAFVDPSIERCLSLQKVYGGSYAGTHYLELLEQDHVDAVVIASPHRYHAEQALAALSRGKAVFLEKPLATSLEQLQQLISYFNTNPAAPLCVGFNRSHAPFIQKISGVIAKRTTPLTVLYRMSVETLPSSHWIQSDENGGRIIGEVCHIIQLFFHLTQARVQAISVETAHAGLTPHFSRDNFVVNLRFDDGSLCTLLYTTLGHASLGKERAEIHTSGVSIVLDDYRTLKGFGTPWGFAEKVYRANKGHHALLTTFIDALRKPSGTLPLSLNHLLDVTYTTLMIDHLAAQQGGDLTMESKNYMSHSHKEIQI